jgi:hypothetical protein
MSGVSDFLRPSGFRLILAATLVIPALVLVLVVTGLTVWEPLVPLVLAIITGYAAACVIDHVVQSRAIKITIASVAALTSIILGSLLVRSMTIICDPVHDPGMVCDPVHIPETPGPTVIATAIPSETTPMIFDPVHEPGGCSGDVCSVAPGVVTGIVTEKLDECRKLLNRQ